MDENRLDEITYKTQRQVNEIIVLKLKESLEAETILPLQGHDVVLATGLKQLLDESSTIDININAEIETGKTLAESAGKNYVETQQARDTISGASDNIKIGLITALSRPGILTATMAKIRFEPVNAYYNRVLTQGITDVRLGKASINTVLKNAVKDLTKSGLRCVNYQSGHVNKLPVAVRRAVLTELQHITNDIHEEIAQQIGTEYYEVDAHPAARPDHAEWQGKIYTYDQLIEKCGLGTVSGLCGANCYHSYYPFVPGISSPKYTQDILNQYKDTTPVSYGGKQFTPYEARQEQRKMETAMRKTREQISLYKKLGMHEEAGTLKSKYTGQRANYKAFSKQTKQKEHFDRVYIDGLGRV